MNSDNLIKKTGELISNNKKPLLYIGGAIAVVVIGFTVVSKLNKGFGGFLTDKSTGASKFVPIPLDKSKVTITDEVANAYANQLFNAMKDAGTNSTMISNIFDKLSKKDDFLKVYNTFGRRSYGQFGEPTIINYVFGYKDYDLIEWLEAEVGNSNPLLWNNIKKVVNNAGFAL